MAHFILAGKFEPGEKVFVNVVDGKLTFNDSEVVPGAAVVH